MRTNRGVAVGISAAFLASAACTAPTSPTGGEVLWTVVAGTTRGALEGPGLGAGDAFVRQLDAGGAPRWTPQFGTGGEDFAAGVATGPRGRVAVVGGTQGDLADPASGLRDENDAFVRVFDADGNVDAFPRAYGP